MVYEYKVLPPLNKKAIETEINKYAMEGWKVSTFSIDREGKYYALMVREKQKPLLKKFEK